MSTTEALYKYVLRLADNNMILAQRLAEWCSCGPILEEDLAITNISLDLLGQAENFYTYAATINKSIKSADDLAFLRSEREYCNSLMVEQPNGDFAFTMMKQMLYSCFAKHLFTSLLNSRDEAIKAMATKALKEVKYHLRHSSEWIIRLGLGSEVSKQKVIFAIDELWRYTDDLFEMNEVDKVLITQGICSSSNDFYPLWKNEIDQILTNAQLNIPETKNIIKGGINGIHTEHLGHILCEMQYLQRAFPGASW